MIGSWRKTLSWQVDIVDINSKAAYPEAHAIAKLVAEALGRPYALIDPQTSGYRVHLAGSAWDYGRDMTETLTRLEGKLADLNFPGVTLRLGRGVAKHRIFAIVPYDIDVRPYR